MGIFPISKRIFPSESTKFSNVAESIGENELMPSSFNFSEKTVGSIVAYSKD